MARPRQIDFELITQAQFVVSLAEDVETLRCAQAVLLPALFGATLEQTALSLGVGRASVPRLQTRFRQLCADPHAARPNWGGRRRASLTLEEEGKFLEPWEKASDSGEVVVASPIRAALSERLGRRVTASVVYRMLDRNGWRKVAPDTRHPKSNPQVQEDWKKNSPKRWRHS